MHWVCAGYIWIRGINVGKMVGKWPGRPLEDRGSVSKALIVRGIYPDIGDLLIRFNPPISEYIPRTPNAFFGIFYYFPLQSTLADQNRKRPNKIKKGRTYIIYLQILKYSVLVISKIVQILKSFSFEIIRGK
jgi:hypothetical protein